MAHPLPINFWIAIELLMCVVMAKPAFCADGIEPLGVSAPAVMRGGADVAVGDTALSQLDNPATLTLHSSHKLDFTGQFCRPDNRWTSPIDSVGSQVPLLSVLNLAYSEPIDDRWSWGTAIHSKAGLGTKYTARHLMIPWRRLTDSIDFKDISIPLNIGYRVNEKLSLGAGIRAEVTTAEFDSVFGPVDMTFERGYAEGIGFQLGLLYKLRKNLTLGLGYRSPTWFTDLEGGDFKGSLLGLPALTLGEAGIDNNRMPQRIAGGLAWDVTSRWKLIEEIRWLNNADSTLGTADITVDGPIDMNIPMEMGYRDQWIFITGAEYKLTDRWTWAVGYNYGTNPLHPQNLLPITSAVPSHHLSTGLRYARDHWWVGGGYILGFQSHLDGNGHSHFPMGIEYGLSELTQTQHFVFLGFGFSW
jgi:long-subunit fatty acid transport protein